MISSDLSSVMPSSAATCGYSTGESAQCQEGPRSGLVLLVYVLSSGTDHTWPLLANAALDACTPYRGQVLLGGCQGCTTDSMLQKQARHRTKSQQTCLVVLIMCLTTVAAPQAGHITSKHGIQGLGIGRRKWAKQCTARPKGCATAVL